VLQRAPGTQLFARNACTPKNVHDENILLKKQLKEAKDTIEALKDYLAKTGKWNGANSGGLIPRPGRPPLSIEKNLPRRVARAEKVLELALIVQGDKCFPRNIVDIVQAAVAKDATVETALIQGGLFPATILDMTDNRTTTGFKEKVSSTLVHPNNACHWQFGTSTTQSSVNHCELAGPWNCSLFLLPRLTGTGTGMRCGTALLWYWKVPLRRIPCGDGSIMLGGASCCEVGSTTSACARWVVVVWWTVQGGCRGGRWHSLKCHLRLLRPFLRPSGPSLA
jgi:hypothetical protein